MEEGNAVLDIIEANKTKVTSNQDIVRQQLDIISNAGGNSVRLIAQQADSKRKASEQLLNAELKAQENSQSIASDLGGNIADPSTFILSTLGDVFRETTLQSMDIKSKVAKLDEQEFLDNPLTWLSNQFEADALDEQAAALDKRSSLAIQRMNAINSAVITGANAQNAITEKLTSDSIAATLDVESLEFKIKANELRANNAATNIKALQALESGDANLLQLELQKFNLIGTIEQRKQSAATNLRAIASAERQVVFDDLRLQKIKKDLTNADEIAEINKLIKQSKQRSAEAKETELALTTNAYRLGAQVFLSPIDPNASDSEVAALMKVRGKGKTGLQHVQSLIDAGLTMQSQEVVTLGNSGADTFLNLNNNNSNTKGTPIEKLHNFLNRVDSSLFTVDPTTKVAKVDSKTTANGHIAVLNNEITSLLTEWESNAETPGALTILPEFGIVTEWGTVKDTKLNEFIIKPAIVGTDSDRSFQHMLDLTVHHVLKGDITEQEAAEDLATMYQSAAFYNSATYFSPSGLPLQSSYKLPVQVINQGLTYGKLLIPGRLESKGVSLDMTKTENVLKVILLEVLKAKRGE